MPGRRCFWIAIEETGGYNMRNTVKVYNTYDRKKGETVYHSIVDGQAGDELDAEELELYKFIVGGMQAK